MDILNTSPDVQNHNIHCYFSLHIFSSLNSSLALALFFKTLLFADIFSPALLFHLPNIRPFIDISLFDLDTWGRVYFVHFLDILNTSPSVQNCKIYCYFLCVRRFALHPLSTSGLSVPEQQKKRSAKTAFFSPLFLFCARTTASPRYASGTCHFFLGTTISMSESG